MNAPLEEVWALHTSIEGLEAFTPAWLQPEIVAVVGPDGTSNPEQLVDGTELTIAVRPFGILPGGSWTAKTIARDKINEHLMFRDVMLLGLFDTWDNTHEFQVVGDRTILDDTVEYTIANSGDLVQPLERAVFIYRHRRTKQLLE